MSVIFLDRVSEPVSFVYLTMSFSQNTVVSLNVFKMESNVRDGLTREVGNTIPNALGFGVGMGMFCVATGFNRIFLAGAGSGFASFFSTTATVGR